MTPEQVKLVGYLIDEIEDHMRSDDFQREFFESLYEQYAKRASLSEKQIASLQKMHERVTQ